MARTVAVSGKGGTGKTTFCALLIEGLLAAGQDPVLAVDADPNSSLGLMLGLPPESTIGDIREDMVEKRTQVSPGVSRDAIVEQMVNECVVESSGFDLIAMGRSEGPGCYCAINMLLRRYLDSLSKSYRFVVMDNEAGMEHLSRRTTRDVDHLFLVAEPTMLGVRTAGRIITLARKLGDRVKNIHLVLNKVNAQGVPNEVEELADGLEVAHVWRLPRSSEIEALSTRTERLVGEGVGLDGIGSIVEALT